MSTEIYKVGYIENWHPHRAACTEKFKLEVAFVDKEEANKLCLLLNAALEKARNTKKGYAKVTWKGYCFDVWSDYIKYVVRWDYIDCPD